MDRAVDLAKEDLEAKAAALRMDVDAIVTTMDDMMATFISAEDEARG
jgi:hypothetical protein